MRPFVQPASFVVKSTVQRGVDNDLGGSRSIFPLLLFFNISHSRSRRGASEMQRNRKNYVCEHLKD